MDISVAYSLCFVVTVILSWAAYRYLFIGSVWEDQISEQLKSLSHYVFYCVVLFIILFIMLYTDNDILGGLLGMFIHGRNGSNFFGEHPEIWVAFYSFAFAFLGGILFQVRFPEDVGVSVGPERTPFQNTLGSDRPGRSPGESSSGPAFDDPVFTIAVRLLPERTAGIPETLLLKRRRGVSLGNHRHRHATASVLGER